MIIMSVHDKDSKTVPGKDMTTFYLMQGNISDAHQYGTQQYGHLDNSYIMSVLADASK